MKFKLSHFKFDLPEKLIPNTPSEEREEWERAQEAAKLLHEKVSEVDPYQVILAGVVILLMIGVILSGWYWVLPRDSVELETHYKQRGGHLMMSELSNDGSRDITSSCYS